MAQPCNKDYGPERQTSRWKNTTGHINLEPTKSPGKTGKKCYKQLTTSMISRPPRSLTPWTMDFQLQHNRLSLIPLSGQRYTYYTSRVDKIPLDTPPTKDKHIPKIHSQG